MALTYDKLNETQKKNAALINAALTKYGITNPYFRAGILAVVAKESGFTPISEGYRYSLKRLREVFSPIRLQNKSDAELTKLLKYEKGLSTDKLAFFNLVYGGAWGAKNLGNTQAGDGFKYRGRGFNQNTGRANYAMISKKSGVDFVSNPDKMNEPAMAAEALAIYFANGFASGKKIIKQKYGVDDQSKITSLKQGADIAYNINAGLGNNPNADTTGGYRQTLDSMGSYFKGLTDFVSENPIKTGGLAIALLLGAGYYFLSKSGLPKIL
jgi:putative chitinase